MFQRSKWRFNPRCDSRWNIDSGISTSRWRYSRALSDGMLRHPRDLSRERRRTIDDDYDKQSRCPRGFVLYRPSSRSSWPSPPFFPSLLSNYITNTRATLVHTSSKSEKKTHSWEKIACAGESSFSPIYRDAFETFSEIVLGYDLSRICLRIGCYPISCAILYVYVEYIARRHRVTSIVVEERCIVIATGRTPVRSIHSETMQRKRITTNELIYKFLI